MDVDEESPDPGGELGEHAEVVDENDLEYDQAIRHGAVSFDQYASAYFYCQPEFNPDSSKIRERYSRYRGPLFAAFVESEGRVSSAYYCVSVAAAGALTHVKPKPFSFMRRTRARVHILDNVPDSLDRDKDGVAALALIGKCDDLALEADEYLTGRWHSVCMGLIFGLLTDALAILDAAAGRLKKKPPEPLLTESLLLEQTRGRYLSVKNFFDRAARRVALFLYLRGVVLSTLILAVASLFLRPEVEGTDVRHALTAGAAGGIGALASVLDRVSRTGLRLDYEAGRARLFLLGAIRPVLGAISGVFAFFLVQGGFVPLQSDPSGETALFAVIGFIAGFSERFAQDMLAYAGSRVGLDTRLVEPELPEDFDADQSPL